MADIYRLYDEIEVLQNYVEMDGPTSDTECTEAMIQLARYPDYLSDELGIVLAKEIVDKLEYYKKNTVIVEEEESFTRKITVLRHRQNS